MSVNEPTKISPFTDDEIAARHEVNDLQTKLADARKRARRPAVIGTEPIELECPFCGSRDLQWEETILNSRNIDEFVTDTDGTTTMFVDTKDHLSEDGDDSRLWCRACFEECAIPDEIQMDWA